MRNAKLSNFSIKYPLPILKRDVAPWYERSLMVRWVVGSILHGGPIDLFLVPTSDLRMV